MYPYHNKILQRIRQGELIGVEKSKDSRFAFVLIFATQPITRPVREHAVKRYMSVEKVQQFLQNEQKR